MEGHQQRPGRPCTVVRDEQVQGQVHPLVVIVDILHHTAVHDVPGLPHLEGGLPVQFPLREKVELRGLVGLQALLIRLEVEGQGIGP